MLTPELVEAARARAEAAGRRYPNLVDNMWAAQKARHARPAAVNDAAGDEDRDDDEDEGAS